MKGLSRRDLLKAGAAGAAVTVPGTSGYAQEADTRPMPPERPDGPLDTALEYGRDEDVLLWFKPDEAKFMEAAIARLIPADDEWPGAKEAGVLVYIDRQLSGAYGSGARMFLNGPWKPDAPPQQGYQLRYTPAELYRLGIKQTREWLGERDDRELWDMEDAEIDEVLSALESGKAQLPSVPAPVFFETLLANTVEGWFADPVYGGNRDMVSWRMVGFPGGYAQYLELVDNYNYRYDREPMGIAGSAALFAQQARKEDG